MTNRVFHQFALGFGTTPAQVTCQIDGNTVYSGTVTTLNQPLPALPNSAYRVDNLAWTWENDADFSGQQSMTIAVTGEGLLLAQTLANNPYGNVDVFGPFYKIEVDGVEYLDPFTDEAIDGVPQSGPYNPELKGQWWWWIPAGSTFTSTLNILAAEIPPPEPS